MHRPGWVAVPRLKAGTFLRIRVWTARAALIRLKYTNTFGMMVAKLLGASVSAELP